MNFLDPDRVNAGISLESFTAAKRLVESNNDIDRSIFFEDYYIRGVIEVSSIKRMTCSLLLLDDNKNKYYCAAKKFDLSFLPPKRIALVTSGKWLTTHVLIRKRIAVDSTFEKVRTDLIVPLEEDTLIGHPSNHIVIDSAGVALLGNFFNKRDDVWLNTPQPRYKFLQKLERKVNGKVAQVQRIFDSFRLTA